MQFKLGKLLGIPITVDASWFIVFALIAVTLALTHFPEVYPDFSPLTNWIAAISASLLLFVSVLLHELAHSVVALRKGMEVSGITLFLFGGVSKLESEPETAGDEFKMAAAGPAASILLGIGFWFLAAAGASIGASQPIPAVMSYLAFINLILAVFNLVPGFPLDGGRVLRAILWGITKSLERATRFASYIGQGFGYLFILFGLFGMLSGNFIGGIWIALIGWFLSNAAQSSYQQTVMRRALTGIHVESIMTRDILGAPDSISLSEMVDSYFMQHNNSVYPVLDEGQVIGTVSVEALQAVPREQWAVTPIAQIMTPIESDRLVSSDEDAWNAFMQMAKKNLQRLLVLRDGHLAGSLSRDTLVAVAKNRLELGYNL